MNKIDIGLLRESISYDPRSGNLTWAKRVSNRCKVGMPALSCPKNSGHLSGSFGGVILQAHRVAWAIHYGEWPNGFIDHINGSPSDNRITNLRVVDRSTNAKNRRPNALKKTGLPHGVSQKSNGKYFAQIQVDGKGKHLGYFHTTEDAQKAYKLARKKYEFHENHGIKALIAEETQ